MLLLLHLPKDKKELLSGFPPLYQNNIQEQGIQDVVNINKINYEPYEAYSKFNETLINNQ